MKQLATDQDRQRDREGRTSETSRDDEQQPARRRAGAGGGARHGKGGAGDHGEPVGGVFSGAINAGLHGAALPDALRARFEASLGVDLAGVRIHTDAAAAHAAEAVDADAFAQGQDIFFAAGRYRPGTPDGDQLIAHEVAHTVQQRGGSAAGPGTMTEPGDAVEHAADAAAHAMTSGGQASIAGGAAQAIARQVRGARPTAPAGAAPTGAATIAQQFPQGITVALALEPREPGEHANAMRGRTVAQITHGRMGQFQAHQRDIRAAVADHPQAVATDDERRWVAEGLAANDRAFRNAALPFASTHRAVGNPEAPTVGQPVMFSQTERSQNAYARVQRLSERVGPLGAGTRAATGNANIKNLAIFTHGWSSGINLGDGAPSSASAFVSRLGGLLTDDVDVQLYACSAALDGPGGAPSFAENVTTGLAQAGHDVHVFGHTTDGPTANNTHGRGFEARAGSDHATSHHNYDLVFTPELRAETVASIAARLEVSPSAVERVFDGAARLWMHGRLANADRNITGVVSSLHRGHADGANLAVAFGTDPAAAATTAQGMWRTEGVAAIANALHVRIPPRTP